MNPQVTLKSQVVYEEEIKRSRFIVHARPVQSPEEALAFLEEIKDGSATHNCWAYRIGDNYRFSDDGEPGGTAGKPIFNALEKQGLTHVMVVVIRYFGGVKLGAGGLVRAYGGTSAKCLQQAPKQVIEIFITGQIKIRFDLIGVLYNAMSHSKGEKLSEDYGSEGIVLQVKIPEASLEEFSKTLQDLSHGESDFIPD